MHAALQVTGTAEVVLPCSDLPATIEFFVTVLGFRIELISPADEPEVATLSGHGLHVRLAPGGGDPGRIRLACAGTEPPATRELLAPNGTRIELVAAQAPPPLPALAPAFTLTRERDAPGMVIGRAGMRYRDLIPGRLGGRYIASHIAIPDGGPVGDWVHYHRVRFQMIYCRRGWVRVAYEDQGEPFVLRAGDCVLQPPGIRHRVLEASAGLEVIEIGSPARHDTLADHALDLPNDRRDPDRDHAGQRFVRHVAQGASWQPIGAGDYERRDTGIGAATRGLAQAGVVQGDGCLGREMVAAYLLQHQITGEDYLGGDGFAAVQLDVG